MYRIKYIEAVGIQCFADAGIELSVDDKVWLVTGNNLDSNRADSNGAGKSGVFNIFSYALTGFIPGKGSEILTCNTDKQDSIARVQLEDTDTGNVLFISREIKGTSKALFVKLNGEHLPDSGEGLKKPQVQLNKHLGLPDGSKDTFDAFLNTVFLTFEFVRGFASDETTSAERITLIMKYLGLDAIGYAYKQARKQRTDVTNDIKTQTQILDSKRAEICDRAVVDDRIVTAKKIMIEMDVRKAEIIADMEKLPDVTSILEQELILKNNLTVLDTRERDELIPLRTKYQNLATDINKLPVLVNEQQRYKQMQEDLKANPLSGTVDDLLKKQSTLASNTALIGQEITNISRELYRLSSHVGYSCPECDTALELKSNVLILFDEEFRLAELERLRIEHAEQKDKLDQFLNDSAVVTSELDKANKRVSEELAINSDLLRVNAEIKRCTNLRPELMAINDKGKILGMEIKDARTALHEELTLLYEGIDLEDIKNTRIQLQDKLKDIEASIENNNLQFVEDRVNLERMIKIADEVQMMQADLDKLTDDFTAFDNLVSTLPAFRVFEISRAIPKLEDFTNNVLRELGSEFEVQFNLDIVGTRTDFNITVCDENGKWRGFGTYSGGERQRIALACALAQRELAQSAGGFQLNILLMDEVFDGLDAQGREALLAYLYAHPAQYFIITHGDLTTIIQDTIVVTRENGISTFKIKD